MHLETRSTITDPSALDPESRRRFGRALFATHRQIFGGLDFEGFYRYVVDSPARRTRIETYHSRAGELVGYCTMHTFERQLMGRSVRVYRVETGLLGAYRGGGRCANFLAREFTRALLCADGREHYFFSCLVHPSSYCGLSRHLDRIWPRPGRTTPPELVEFVSALADEFGLSPVVDRDPIVRRVGWVTRESREEQERWRQSADPRVRLYLRTNPDYSEGLGMNTLIQVTPWSVISGFSRNLLYKLRRRLTRLFRGSEGRYGARSRGGAQARTISIAETPRRI